MVFRALINRCATFVLFNRSAAAPAIHPQASRPPPPAAPRAHARADQAARPRECAVLLFPCLARPMLSLWGFVLGRPCSMGCFSPGEISLDDVLKKKNAI